MEMKGITCCGDCAYYSFKKHKCTQCQSIETDARSHFFDDCPLPNVVEKTWHDLRKNPDDVPMINHKVLIGCYNDDFHVARFLINSQGQKHWNTSDNRWIRHEDVCWWKEFDKPSCRRAEILYKQEERENDK